MPAKSHRLARAASGNSSMQTQRRALKQEPRLIRSAPPETAQCKSEGTLILFITSFTGWFSLLESEFPWLLGGPRLIRSSAWALIGSVVGSSVPDTL